MSEPSPAGLPSVIHYLNRGDSYRLGPPEQ
jgi:hypothetical protein